MTISSPSSFHFPPLRLQRQELLLGRLGWAGAYTSRLGALCDLHFLDEQKATHLLQPHGHWPSHCRSSFASTSAPAKEGLHTAI